MIKNLMIIIIIITITYPIYSTGLKIILLLLNLIKVLN